MESVLQFRSDRKYIALHSRAFLHTARMFSQLASPLNGLVIIASFRNTVHSIAGSHCEPQRILLMNGRILDVVCMLQISKAFAAAAKFQITPVNARVQ